MDRVEDGQEQLEEGKLIGHGYLAGKKEWEPYPDEARNRHIMDGLRRHNLLN